jgi:hypothetical protein
MVEKERKREKVDDNRWGSHVSEGRVKPHQQKSSSKLLITVARRVI